MLDSNIVLTQEDITLIENAKTLRPIARYGSSVHRNLVQIHQKYTGEITELKTCCASERAIYFNNFIQWYDSIQSTI